MEEDAETTVKLVVEHLETLARQSYGQRAIIDGLELLRHVQQARQRFSKCKQRASASPKLESFLTHLGHSRLRRVDSFENPFH
jgi:hypothetical protein